MTKILALILVGTSSFAWAQATGFGPGCQMTKGLKFNFFISSENKNSGLFGPTVDRQAPAVISNCQGAAGKVLGFGLGLRQPYLSSDASDVSFTGELREEVCHIENSPVSTTQGFPEKEANFEKQFKFLRTCAYIEVMHLDNKPLSFNPDQKFCKIRRITPSKIAAEGDFCYIRVQPDTRVALSVVTKPECQNEKFLQANGINPQDIEASLQSFVLDNDSSLVTENMVGSSKVRLSLLPPSRLMSINRDVGPEQPAFPTTFSADVHAGQIIIQDGSFGDDKKTFFDLSLFVDSRSARNCVSGTCAGPGDFQLPLAGEVEFYEVNQSQRKFLDSWYSGNTVDPFVKSQWQGLFKFGRKTSEGLEVKPGRTYEMQFNFYNPYDDYIMLIKGYEQILVDLTLMNGTPGLDYIQSMQSLRSLLGLPDIPQLPQLGVMQLEEQLEKVRQEIAKLGTSLTYPPYYEKVCTQDMKSCLPIKSTGKYLTLTTRFELGPKDPETGHYILKDIRTTRQSPYLPNYQKPVSELPRLVCPR